MEANNTGNRGCPKEWQEIWYVQRLVADICSSDVYKPLGLHSLELTRRFNNSLHMFEKNGDRKQFHQLLIITGNLAKRLENGQL